jgi:hypothetical protein
VNLGSRSEIVLPQSSDNASYVTYQDTQGLSLGSIASTPNINSHLPHMDLSAAPVDHPPQTVLNGSYQLQDAASVSGLFASMPMNHSTLNWLGFGDGTGFNGSLNHEWQYPENLFDFYMPASDTQSIAAVSPVTSRNMENVVGGSTTHSSHNAFTPQDDGTTDTVNTDARLAPPGQFYADGGTARLPRMRKRRALTSQAAYERSRQMFSMLLPSDLTVPFSINRWLDDQGYAELQSHYSNFCTSSISLFAPFEAVELPPKTLFDYLCDLYADNCSSILPFVHLPSVRLQNCDPLLALGMAAIGSHYLKHPDLSQFVLSLHEFVRRVLFLAVESLGGIQIKSITQYQITLLHAVGATYSGERTLRDQAFALRLKLVSFFLNEHGPIETTNITEDSWSQWIEKESFLRLRHCTWLMDCMWSFQFQTKTMLSLSDATLALPTSDLLWSANTATCWAELMHVKQESPDLATAINDLYMSKRVPTDAGEFVRILLIYGLHRRLSEVAAYYSQNLSHWIPKDHPSAGASILLTAPVWLPSLPIFQQWQNLTCDSLDVLHWAANAAIGEASGFEHPTVLHLHLARVILLTPIKEIVNLARYLAGEKGLDPEAVVGDRQAVHRWANQHQYKARLSAVHGGVVYWHIRRFSTNAFYEPTAVAHAALVLWAFSAFSSKTAIPPVLQTDDVRTGPANTDVQINGYSSESESSSDTIILLDRPADDEIVQEFVMNGPRMRANMTAVGDLYGEKGPERVLREGTRILRTLGCWREWEFWLNVLEKLVVVCKRERKKMKGATSTDGQALSVPSTRDTGC